MSMTISTSDIGLSYGRDDDREYHDYLARVQARFLANVGGGPVFTTDVNDNAAHTLYHVYLDNVPDRQHHTCQACRKFLENYGGLVTIEPETGRTDPAIWDEADAPEYYRPAVAAVARAVRKAMVTGVFLSADPVWGTPVTPSPKTGITWHHYAVTPPKEMVYRGKALTAGQAMAEKREDFKNVSRALREFNREVVNTAVRLLEGEQLYRSEKVAGPAKWLKGLHDAIQSKNHQTVNNVIWRAVATAPAGFCHPRSSMIGTLLDDIAGGMSFADASKRFASKMHPLQYQRPQAAPSAGTIAQAEKLVETLGIARSLERRFARLDEIETIWTPKIPARSSIRTIKIEEAGSARLRVLLRDAGIDPSLLDDGSVMERYRGRFGDTCIINSNDEQDRDRNGGVFGHLQAKDSAPAVPAMTVPPITMTWDKFSRVVLPTAESIECYIGTGPANFTGLLTATHADAPPILQWDREEWRNPVSQYVYNHGSLPRKWGLVGGRFHKVTAVACRPSMWRVTDRMAHMGIGIILILDGAKDGDLTGNAIFPETLRSELHGVRSVVEAYARTAKVTGIEEASACGLGLSRGGSWDVRLRVTGGGGVQEYRLDRWD